MERARRERHEGHRGRGVSLGRRRRSDRALELAQERERRAAAGELDRLLDARLPHSPRPTITEEMVFAQPSAGTAQTFGVYRPRPCEADAA